MCTSVGQSDVWYHMIQYGFGLPFFIAQFVRSFVLYFVLSLKFTSIFIFSRIRKTKKKKKNKKDTKHFWLCSFRLCYLNFLHHWLLSNVCVLWRSSFSWLLPLNKFLMICGINDLLNEINWLKHFLYYFFHSSFMNVCFGFDNVYNPKTEYWLNLLFIATINAVFTINDLDWISIRSLGSILIVFILVDIHTIWNMQIINNLSHLFVNECVLNAAASFGGLFYVLTVACVWLVIVNMFNVQSHQWEWNEMKR